MRRISGWAACAALLAMLQGALPVRGAGEGYVDLRFDQAEVRAFAAVMGELLDRRFVVDESVKGRVTVSAPDVPAADAYALMVTVLESAGCTAWAGADGVTRIVPLAGGAGALGAVLGPDDPVAGVGLMTKVIRLRHVSAAEVKAMLAEVTGGDRRGTLGVLPAANLLVASGSGEWVRRIETMVAGLDKPGLSRVMEVLPLKHASAEDIARQITEAMTAMESEADRIRQQIIPGGRAASGIKAVASPQANGLILVGPQAAVDEMKALVAKLDMEPESGRGRLRAIFLKYLTAEDAAKSLKALLAASAASGKAGGAGGHIGIEPSVANNALLVDASPREFEVVEKLIQELDRMPGQVLIEVLIAEVSATQSDELGVELAGLGMPDKVGGYAFQGSATLNDSTESLMKAVETGLFPNGLTVGLAHGVRLAADGTLETAIPAMINIQAMRKEGRFRILSNVPLLAQNNQEASVSVVNNIPVLKSTIQGGTGASRDVIQNIERLDVGIKLKLTPHINPDGEVRMQLNPSIEAIVDPGAAGTFTPTIARRDVQTTVTVPDGETIVLSGLIREDQTRSERRVPILGSLPLLGWLFRRTVEGRERTNLMIFVTPRVLRGTQDGIDVTRELEERTGLSSTNQPGRIEPDQGAR